MSNQELQVLSSVDASCCAPLACEPLSEAGADDLAPLFNAVADPMRRRLLSLIACHEGGESCVCDLADAFEVTAPTRTDQRRAAGDLDPRRDRRAAARAARRPGGAVQRGLKRAGC